MAKTAKAIVRMDERTSDALVSFLRDVRSLPNESAKTSRFMALIGELFPGAGVATRLAEGVEKLVRIDTGDVLRRGRVDVYYGNAVIEFEKSLRATGANADRQLREYVCGVWREEAQRRPLVCIASDGIEWKVFRPSSELPRPAPDDVVLEPLRGIVLTEPTAADFWIWLTSLLFRETNQEPTAERFRADFGVTSLAFAEASEALGDAWRLLSEVPEAKLAYRTWLRYLTLTYGSLGEGNGSTARALSGLFMKHTYLVSLSRLMVWAMLSGGRTSRPLIQVAHEVLSGEYFEAERVENLVEQDFFQWIRRPPADERVKLVWERILAQLLTYDLTRLRQDVLKGLYQELIDPRDRHDLGEYYTPDWLCEAVLSELLPETGFCSVIDPTCGSDSFLRAAITHLLAANPGEDQAAILQAVLRNVVGIDIHPVAVTISRATYILALGNLVRAAKRPIQIPVYLADSLSLPTEVRQMELGGGPAFEIKFGRESARIAEDIVTNPDVFDTAVATCTEVAEEHARTGRESATTLASYIGRVMPDIAQRDDFHELLGGLWSFTEALASLIRTHEDSIWSFIVRNGYRPAMLKGHFDFVVGNPPWLSYRYIADPEYQKEVKRRAVSEYQIAPKAQKLITQMELATVFMVHALSMFGRQGSRLGFVMPRGVLTADQHSQLRARKYSAPVALTEYWDLMDVHPLFNVPACVLFAARERPGREKRYQLPAVEWSGRLPTRDLAWSEAADHLQRKKKTGHLIYLAERTALSTAPGNEEPGRPSPYARSFRQGATIVPRSVYFVKAGDLNGPAQPDHLYWVETDDEQAALAKEPYKDVFLKGEVEGQFLFAAALSRDLLPFVIRQPLMAVLPVIVQGGHPMVWPASRLSFHGFRNVAKWFQAAEEIWDAKRGRKADRQTLYEWLDYQGKLSAQDLAARYVVLYNAAGMNLSAAVLDRQQMSTPLIVEHKLYWAACENPDEAYYLSAILNSRTVDTWIKPFQTAGLLGERDIEKRVLDLPIPRFDSSNALHLELARLGADARALATDLSLQERCIGPLARQRVFVRQNLARQLGEIDQRVKALLTEGG